MSFIAPKKATRIERAFALQRPQYQVTAAMVVAQRMSGGEVYVHRGGLLPGDADFAHVEQLLELGMVRKIEEAAK